MHGVAPQMCGRVASLSNRIQVRPLFASKNDPSDGAETGVAEPHVAEQSRSWWAAGGEQEITPRKRISDAVDDAARRPTAPRAPAVLDPITAIAQSCAMSEVAAETAAEQGIRATCPATPMLSDA